MTVLNRRPELCAKPQRHWSKSWPVGLLLGCCALSVRAETSCNVQTLPDASPDVTLSTLRSQEASCHKQAPFLYALGQLLNKMGRYDEAIDPLEGALMYRPDHWPSQLEYAIALEGIGDHESAVGLLKSLLLNPGLDSDARKQIAALEQRPAPHLPVRHQRGTIGLATGVDNNVLGSTYHTQFTLTTPDGGLPVELDEEQRARAGSFLRTDVSLDGVLAASSGTQWRYGVGASYRSTPNLPVADQGQWSVLLERSSQGNQGPYVLGQRQSLLRSGDTILQQTQWGMGFDFALGNSANCRQRLGLDALHTVYPTSPVSNGRYFGLLSHTNCPGWGLQVQLRAGEDQPLDPARPGGVQRQSILRVSKLSPMGAAALALDWEVAHRQDQSGYSTLLDNNAPRNMLRYAYRAEYRWRVQELSPYVGFEWLDQRANLPLFELKNRVMTLGFRSNW